MNDELPKTGTHKPKYPFVIEKPIEENRPETMVKRLGELLSTDFYKLPLGLYMDMCARCNNCAENCHVYLATGQEEDLPAWRSERVRRIYKKYFTRSGKLLGRLVGAKELTEDDIDALLESVYRCTMCRRCNLDCPMGIDNALLARTGRVMLAALNLAPKNFTVSVTSQLEGEGFNTSGIPKLAWIDTLEFLDEEIEEAIGKKGYGFPIDKEGAEILFIAPASDYMVEAETLMGNAIALNAAGADWTVGTEFFDAINYGLFYSDEELANVLMRVLEQAKTLGVRKIVVGECGHATKTAKLFPEIVDPGSKFEVENIMEFTARAIREGRIKADPSKNQESVTYHDPCNLGRMGGVIEPPREIIRACAVNFREMTPHGGENFCCGGGGGGVTVPDMHDFRMNVSGAMKVKQLKDVGTDLLAAPCANCKKQLRELVEYHKLPTKVIGVHDLLIHAIVLDD